MLAWPVLGRYGRAQQQAERPGDERAKTMKTFVRALGVIILLALCCTASAQIQNPGTMQIGPITPGHCAVWIAPFKIGDSDGPC
jgi:hypothetical protein